MRRPGLGNALIVPRALTRCSRPGAATTASATCAASSTGCRWWRDRAPAPNWRQFGELRIWIEARLRDRESQRDVHRADDAPVGRAEPQAPPGARDRRTRAGRAPARPRRARRRPQRARHRRAGPRRRDRHDARAADRTWATLATAGPNIDYVLADGFAPVAHAAGQGDSLSPAREPERRDGERPLRRRMRCCCFEPTR